MCIYRSLIFIPSSNTKMLDKIELLNPDGFILDLEDSVPPHLKETARININNKIDTLTSSGLLNLKDIFVRINDLESSLASKDVEVTLRPEVCGYVIPKFEGIGKLQSLENELLKKEKSNGITAGKIKLILMVESPKGLSELSNIRNHDREPFFQRIIAVALGFEDFVRNTTVFGNISSDMFDFVRKSMLIYAKANNFLAIDTVYKNFKDTDGLRNDTIKSASMGFDGRLAIHPSQIDIINSCFMPKEEDIKKMELILSNKGKIENEGAISINDIMYDPPHLKWAEDIKDYLDKIENK